jgi:hypothetical protein
MADKTQGQLVITALIIPLHSSTAPPRPHPQPPQPGQPPTGGEHPDHTLPGELPKPEHPIYWPLPPGAPVDPDYGIPEGGEPPHPDQGLPPVQGGGQPPHPDQGLPGPQPHPEHPIVLPPDQGEGGWGPIYIWGGGPGARPPIAVPPDGETEEGAEIKFKAVWTPANGWQTIGVVVPGGDHVTPSKKK